MAESKTHDIAAQLAAGLQHSGPDAQSPGDPIVDTPIVVTLDQLRPYDLNPRITRNPRHDDIKTSIRERGLDAPPAITRRPGEQHFIIRNGGNTRLSILRELWTETRDEKFFRIACLFRPWPARGEIVALTGHLAENELHGGLSFIERALGVEKARELYERETGKPLTQMELARRLTGDGYPVTQQHISRMQEAVRYLLPAIPAVLYAGLGKPQIERLIGLRKAAERIWVRHAQHMQLTTHFTELFQDVLGAFDGDAETFGVQRVQDEFARRLSELFGVDYERIALELVDAEAVQRASGQAEPTKAAAPLSRDTREHGESLVQPSRRLQVHTASLSETHDHREGIQRTVADDVVRDFHPDVVRAAPAQPVVLLPISQTWHIEPALDAPERLRAHIFELAREIAQEANLADHIESVNCGVGFKCTSTVSPSNDAALSMLGLALLGLLNALSAPYTQAPTRVNSDSSLLADDFGPLLLGASRFGHAPRNSARLSDGGLVRLFDVIRLARRLLELESSVSSPSDGALKR